MHELNKYFCNVGHSVIVDINNELSRMGTSLDFSEICYTGSLFLRPVTELEISNVIDNLKKNGTPGHDGICVNDLLLIKNIILPVLVKLINTAFQTGIYPDVLKISRVIPIFKAGEHNKIHNYRSISLIGNISSELD